MKSGVSYTVNATFDTSLTFEYTPPDGKVYTYEQDNNGNVVLNKAAIDYVEPEIISTKPEPLEVPSIPVLNIARSYGTYIKYYRSSISTAEYMVKTINVSWEEATNAEYYQVFLLTDIHTSNSVLRGTDTDPKPMPGSGIGASLFMLDSGPLGSLDFNYTFDVSDDSPYNAFPRVTAFVFSYNGLYGRSRFPLTMMSFVADGKQKHSAINRLFIENTSLRLSNSPNGQSINIVDETNNIGGATANLESKAMPEYVYVPVTSGGVG